MAIRKQLADPMPAEEAQEVIEETPTFRAERMVAAGETWTIRFSAAAFGMLALSSDVIEGGNALVSFSVGDRAPFAQVLTSAVDRVGATTEDFKLLSGKVSVQATHGAAIRIVNMSERDHKYTVAFLNLNDGVELVA